MKIDDAAAGFAAIGQATRLELVFRLLAGGEGGMAAGDIATALGVVPSTLSFHLRTLEEAGLIGATRQGRQQVYTAQRQRLFEVLSVFDAALAGSHGSNNGSPPMPPPFTVLFLCTRNAARSIMAEAILSKLAPGRFVAYSAGSDPAPRGPFPEVLAQLKALGHDVTGLRSKSWDEFAGPDAPRLDFVIALCDVTAGQVCPEFGASTVSAAWPLPDPARFNGSAAERAALLNELYAGLRRRLEAFVALPIQTLGSIALKARIDELADPHLRSR